MQLCARLLKQRQHWGGWFLTRFHNCWRWSTHKNIGCIHSGYDLVPSRFSDFDSDIIVAGINISNRHTEHLWHFAVSATNLHAFWARCQQTDKSVCFVKCLQRSGWTVISLYEECVAHNYSCVLTVFGTVSRSRWLLFFTGLLVYVFEMSIFSWGIYIFDVLSVLTFCANFSIIIDLNVLTFCATFSVIVTLCPPVFDDCTLSCVLWLV